MVAHIELLKTKFDQKRARNERYSLRSFSRLLGVDAGSLSAILRGRRPLSLLKARQIADRLRLTTVEKRDFYQSLFSQSLSTRDALSENFSQKASRRELDDVRYFQIIAEWEFAAALSLMDTKFFSLSIEALRERLGLTRSRAKHVILTLTESGLVERLTDGRLIKQEKKFGTSQDVRSMALERSHLQSLELAEVKLRKLNVDERDFSSITIAARSDRLAEMKLVIQQFRRDFEARFESNEGDTVFQMNLQLFPASTKGRRP